MNAAPSTGPRPDADVGIDPELVRALLSAQHPDLAGLELRFVDDGWDNAVYRLGPDLAVRLPRRAGAHSLLLNELRWLPFLAPRLPVPIPVPVRGGKPGEGYPYHWAIMPWFEGSERGNGSAAGTRSLRGPAGRVFPGAACPGPGGRPEEPGARRAAQGPGRDSARAAGGIGPCGSRRVACAVG